MQCPACATDVPAGSDNLFCEECGAPLSAAPAAPVRGCVCGAPVGERDDEGFCLRCGRKHRIALPSDRMEDALSPSFAAVCDRGLRHDHNEDRVGIVAAGDGFAMVVCDGVSTSRSSEIASGAVVEGVRQSLARALTGGAIANPAKTMRAAIAAGNSHLSAGMNLETRRTSASRKLRRLEENPPSTTVVAALVVGGVATIGWVGDSRAYWIDSAGALPLTRDHSWQNEVVEAGEMTAEAAAKAPRAHAITRWIGMDAGEVEPDITTRALDGAGTLLLCTDGLWNYAPTPEEIDKLVTAATMPDKDALQTARELVQFALDSGGQDNVTVAVLRLDKK